MWNNNAQPNAKAPNAKVNGRLNTNNNTEFFGNDCVQLSNTFNQMIFVPSIYSYEQNLFFPSDSE